MSSEKIVVGLDIGTTKVCAIVGKQNEHGKIIILGIGKAESDGVSKGVVTNIDKTVEAIKTAVEEAERMSNISIKVVHVGIAGEHIKSMQHKGMITLSRNDEEISIEDVDRLHMEMFKIASPPGTDIIHVIPQEYTVDNQSGIKEPVGMSGIRLEGNFHIVMGQTTAANNIYKCVRKAELDAKELVLEPLASSAAVLSDDELEAGVCLVDIGGGTTDIAIFEDGIIRHTAVIPFGGNIVTEDIKFGCSVMKKQAEMLKIKYGSAVAAEIKDEEVITIPGLKERPPKKIKRKTLAEIIQSRMEEIIEFVAAEIHHSGYKNKLVGGIVVTGGGSQLNHIKQLFEYVTGIDTRIGYPGEHLASGLVEEGNSPVYATSIGLVVYGFENRKIELDNSQDIEPEITNPIPKTPVKPKIGFSFVEKIKNIFENTLKNQSNLD